MKSQLVLNAIAAIATITLSVAATAATNATSTKKATTLPAKVYPTIPALDSPASTNLAVRDGELSSTFPSPREVLQEGLSPHVDIMLGLSNPEGSYSSSPEYGFAFGFQPYIPFGMGMSLTYSSNPSKYTDTRKIDRTTVLVWGTYNFAGDIPVIKYSHVGVGTGPVINQDATYFGLVPMVGFDIPVREWSGEYLSYLSFGAQAKYTIISNNESDGFTVNGTMKYWF